MKLFCISIICILIVCDILTEVISQEDAGTDYEEVSDDSLEWSADECVNERSNEFSTSHPELMGK